MVVNQTEIGLEEITPQYEEVSQVYGRRCLANGKNFDFNPSDVSN